MLPRLAALLVLASAACAPAPRPPARALSAEQRKRVDRRYYEAVDAYMKNDYAGARAALREILAAEPGHSGALNLLARIRAAEKASAAP